MQEEGAATEDILVVASGPHRSPPRSNITSFNLWQLTTLYLHYSPFAIIYRPLIMDSSRSLVPAKSHTAVQTYDNPNVITINGRVYSNDDIKGIRTAIDQLPSSPATGSLIVAAEERFLHRQAKEERGYVDWDDWATNRIKISFPNESELKAVEAERMPFRKRTGEFRKNVSDTDKARSLFIEDLRKSKLARTRAERFGDYIQTDYSEMGRDFYRSLRSVLTKGFSVRELIRVLNMKMVERCTRAPTGKRKLAQLDAHEAFTWASEKVGPGPVDHEEAWYINIQSEIPDLKLASLRTLGLRFGSSGILIPARDGPELFPPFSDEPPTWPAVNVISFINSPLLVNASSDSGLQVVGPKALDELAAAEPLRAIMPLDSLSGKVSTVEARPKRKRSELSSSTPKSRAPKRARLVQPREGASLSEASSCSVSPDQQSRIASHEFCGMEGLYLLLLAYVEGNMCQAHMTQLWEYLYLKPASEADLKQVLLLYLSKIGELANSVRERAKSPTSKLPYCRTVKMDKRSSSLATIPLRLVSSISSPVDWPAVGAHVLRNHFAWTDSVSDMLLAEIEMLAFHARQRPVSSDGYLENGYFTLAAQLLWADPTVWLLFHQTLPEHPTFLVAQPLPVRVYEPGDTSHAFHSGGSHRPDRPYSLHADVLIHGDVRGVSYCPPIDPEHVLSNASEETTSVSDRGIENDDLWDCLDRGRRDGRVKAYKVNPSDLILCRSGTIVGHVFRGPDALTKRRVSVPLSLVNIGRDDRISLRTLQESHCRMREPGAGELPDGSFPWSIRLKGMGALFEMTTGVSPPDDDAIQDEIRKWLEYGEGARGPELYSKWKETAIDQVRVAFRALRDAEMALFPGNESYFRCMLENPEPLPTKAGYVVVPNDEA